MANQLFGNNLKAALSLSTAPGSLTPAGMVFTLVSGAGNDWPTPSVGDYVLVTLYEVNGLGQEINHEVVKVTNRTADTFTIGTRDFELSYVGVGRSFPDVPANNPSGLVYAALRYTAYAAGNTLNKDDNLASLASVVTAKTNLGLQNVNNTSNATERAATATLTNKTIALGSNTVSGTLAQFNTAVTDADLVSLTGAEALTNKTIVAATNTITTAASGNLTSTNLNAALAELQSDVDTRATSSALTTHTGLATGAHAATAISTVASGNLVATNVGTALNELQSDIDTRALNSALTTHTGLATGAHAATAISSVASGNLAATNVGAALNELQSDIDTRILTTAKDATGGVVGLTLFKINIKNAANTFTNFFTNATTAARTWTFPDKDGTVAMTVDITGTNSGTNTGDNAINTLYSGLVTNQTHTGDATGSVALIVSRINGVALSGLATGILKNTTSTGAPSIAVAGTDYVTPAGIETLTNKTIVAASNTITTAASGNLTSTNVNAALAELQSDIDTRATSSALTTHTGLATGAHAATAISTVASGNLLATNVGAALNELQSDIDTRALNSALTTHTGLATGAHAASAISYAGGTGMSATNVEAAIDELATEKVSKTSDTGSAILPVGTTAQRDGGTPAGYLRYNNELGQFEGYGASGWGAVGGGGGAVGGGSNAAFYENDITITDNYTLTSGKNAMSTGPITINTGVTVTVPSGARWVVL